jgi:hypothetical protein
MYLYNKNMTNFCSILSYLIGTGIVINILKQYYKNPQLQLNPSKPIFYFLTAILFIAFPSVINPHETFDSDGFSISICNYGIIPGSDDVQE